MDYLLEFLLDVEAVRLFWPVLDVSYQFWIVLSFFGWLWLVMVLSGFGCFCPVPDGRGRFLPDLQIVCYTAGLSWMLLYGSGKFYLVSCWVKIVVDAFG